MKFLAFLGKKVILIWSFLLFMLLALSSVAVKTTMPMDGSEMANMRLNGYIFSIGLIIFLCLFYLCSRSLVFVKESQLFIFWTVLYLIFGVYLIWHQNDVLRHDSLAVLDAAKAINKGSTHLLTDISGYLHKYPHQLGLVSFERLILTIFGETNIKIFFVLNLFMTIVENFFLWRITRRLFRNEQISKLVILLSFLFLPQLFTILFVYGLTYGFFFAIIGLYFVQCYLEKRTWKTLVASVIFLTLSYMIRNNYIILILTILIILVLDFFHYKIKKNVVFVVLLLSAMTLSNQLLSAYYKDLAKISKLEGEPKIAWVAMGLNDTPEYNRVGGWYDAFVENVYNDHAGNAEAIEKASKKQIANRIHYMIEHPLYACRFFGKKFLSTWTDSLFESIWSGPVIKMPVEGQKIRGYLMSSIYEGKVVYKWLYGFSALLLVMIYGSILPVILQFFQEREMNVYLLIPLIYLSGGFLFHLVWETKSQYVYPYVYLLLPLSAFGIDYVTTLIKRLKLKKLT
ncbi:glycosyltransferase family 39 protein [Streptococcus anginosus]|uniref:glycosyltransferase family 39 protein n=1 Tax=Streptococcus anginosus TaxID=1328 RepID=UPI0030814FC1|nr:glycosyltransferase family 39 protein [Streptococcus anginosus]